MAAQQARDIVVVGASAGGVEAIGDFIRHLPADLPAAVFVVLHVPAHTPSQLANILSKHAAMKVVTPEDGEPIARGTVYVASSDRHLMVDGGKIRVTRGPKEGRARPSIDVLFRSAAVSCGPRVMGVVLTGALDDGTAGLWLVKDNGGVAMAQTPAGSFSSSMPESAIKHVEVDFIGTPGELAEEVTKQVRASATPFTQKTAAGSRAVELEIAAQGNGMNDWVTEPGRPSGYTCPGCHGVLLQIEEGPILRFRCPRGHAFSLQALVAEVNESIDKGLWDTLRAVEERIMLLGQMEDLARLAGEHEQAELCRMQASDAEDRVDYLRKLVLDPRLFG